MRKLIRPKVTVIMNVHNGEEFISEAIASVILSPVLIAP